MGLKVQITDDMKAAMRAKAKEELGTIRLLLSAIKQKEVDGQTELEDADVLAVVEKLVKQRKDSAKAYRDADRADLAEKEEAEIVVLQKYLPAQLSEAKIQETVQSILTETGANSMADMGKVMGIAKGKFAGKADMAVVSKLIKNALQQQ